MYKKVKICQNTNNLRKEYKEMEEEISKKSVDNLDINNNIINILKSHRIRTIEQLCKKSKSDLKRIEILSNDIMKIEIELQLLGLNLKNSL